MVSGSSLIKLFVRHKTASNLLMITMLILGVYALVFKLKVQFFPDVERPVISISVSWPGASADDVEQNIVTVLEPELRFINDIKEVKSYGYEGSAKVSLEFAVDADMKQALSDVETAVARITTLPEDSEEPIITPWKRYDRVISLLIYGELPEKSLKSYAKRIRDELLDLGVDRITIDGARDEEILVEIPQAKLNEYSLTIKEIAQRISSSNKDTPAGTVKNLTEKQVRTLGLNKNAEGIGNIEIKSFNDGNGLILSDISNVSNHFSDDASIVNCFGKPCIELDIYRTSQSDMLVIDKIVNNYLDNLLPSLPKELNIKRFFVRVEHIKERIWLLINNGIGGLIIVIGMLFLFLNARTAFWVAIGIPTSLAATALVLWGMGQSINMISLFALIMTIGIVVDDAIVVGEHTVARRTMGETPLMAAENAALRMFAPVFAATLTTQAAFLPVAMISGFMGQFMLVIPIVVISVLTASLIESFLILPGHLRGHGRSDKLGKPSRFRLWFDERFIAFRDGAFTRFMGLIYDWRYTVISIAVVLLAISIFYIKAGHINIRHFPSPETSRISTTLTMISGTSKESTEKTLRIVEKAMFEAEKDLTNGKGGLIVAYKSSLSSGNSAKIRTELVASEQRDIRTRAFVRKWLEKARNISGIDELDISGGRGGPRGKDIEFEIIGDKKESLRLASEQLVNILQDFSGVNNIVNEFSSGGKEVSFTINQKGKALGLTTNDIGQQVRHGLHGITALRFANNDEEVEIKVRIGRENNKTPRLSELYIRTVAGDILPLLEVVNVVESNGAVIVKRINGKRMISVSAEVDPESNNYNKIINEIREKHIPNIEAKYGVIIDKSSRSKEEGENISDIKIGVIVAIILIYIILAWVFASYTKPIVVMTIIPFSIVGALFGHIIMGFDLSILSFVGLLGLSGIVVNDSIILISEIQKQMKDGKTVRQASILGSAARFRAVLLTSLTTIGGLIPLLFEKSLQAQFLLPIAITLVFGLGFATLLVLLLIPSLVGIQDDFGRGVKIYKDMLLDVMPFNKR